jgi:hypothetical protein
MNGDRHQEDPNGFEESFEEVSPSQSQFSPHQNNSLKKPIMNQAKKINVHNPFAENNAESPSAPSSGYANDSSNYHNKMHGEQNEQKPVDPNDPYADEPSILEGKYFVKVLHSCQIHQPTSRHQEISQTKNPTIFLVLCIHFFSPIF